jgi:hypothetical protein
VRTVDTGSSAANGMPGRILSCVVKAKDAIVAEVLKKAGRRNSEHHVGPLGSIELLVYVTTNRWP